MSAEENVWDLGLKERVRWCFQQFDSLSDWDIPFLATLHKVAVNDWELSPKQQTQLTRIINKLLIYEGLEDEIKDINQGVG